jgi:predicted DNA-binding protein (UPF0251 family)
MVKPYAIWDCLAYKVDLKNYVAPNDKPGPKPTVTDEIKEQIRKLSPYLSQRKIAAKVGISQASVWKVLNG